jgi:hypothetical protein
MSDKLFARDPMMRELHGQRAADYEATKHLSIEEQLALRRQRLREGLTELGYELVAAGDGRLKVRLARDGRGTSSKPSQPAAKSRKQRQQEPEPAVG